MSYYFCSLRHLAFGALAVWCLKVDAQTTSFNGIEVPGVVITHSPAASKVFIGSPSIAILPNGDYVASHDEFGPMSSEAISGTTQLFCSNDRGKNWRSLSTLQDQFWSNLFVHSGELYIMGPRRGPSKNPQTRRDLLIRRSTDGGSTWTTPTDATTGVIAIHPPDSAGFHTAPVPVVEHAGRLWRALEIPRGGFRPVLISAPLDSDLLKAENWQLTNSLGHQPSWLPNNGFRFWIEGNAVVGPNDQLVNILRVSVRADEQEKAAVVRVVTREDSFQLEFDPSRDIVNLPGGAKKFTIRYDPVSASYWTLTNVVNEQNFDPETTPGGIRNIVAMLESTDLIHWKTRSTVLQDLTDVKKIGFQYLDWQFDGADIVAVSRTSYPDGMGGAENFHNSNFLTFHRIHNFRIDSQSARD
ncbi:MAG: exo-alpha-sialidase [Planctomycetales bacterium]|nr:exo-alpha-sialidase [Planctomycetales bacterium]